MSNDSAHQLDFSPEKIDVFESKVFDLYQL